MSPRKKTEGDGRQLSPEQAAAAAMVAEAKARGIGRALTLARLHALAARTCEVWYFANARNKSSLDPHATLGFVEVTRDF